MYNEDTPSIVFFDIEYTTWEGAQERLWSGPGETMEIVQIGAVKVNLDQNLEETSSFETLVRPEKNPVLSEYFISLTGVTQEALDREGVELSEALFEFGQFIRGTTGDAYSFGLTDNNFTDEIVLQNNCKLMQIDWPLEHVRFRNIAPFILPALGRSAESIKYSCDLAPSCGLPNPGREHQALSDARNVAATVRYLMRSNRITQARVRHFFAGAAS